MKAKPVKIMFIVMMLLWLCVSVTGCGSGVGGCATDADLKQIEAEKARDKQFKESQAAKSAPGEVADGTVMKAEGPPEGEPAQIWKAGNDGGIELGTADPPQVYHDQDYYVTELVTYHCYGDEKTSGTITLKSENGTVYGPWETELVNRVYWTAKPDMVIPKGTYTLIDSDPSTWSQNSGSNGEGMGWAKGLPAK